MGHSHVEDKPNVSSNSAMWFGLLIIVLLVSAINFVKVSSGGHGHEVAHHEATTDGHDTKGHDAKGHDNHSETPAKKDEGTPAPAAH